MNLNEIPNLSEKDRDEGLLNAKISKRLRFPKILHQPGDDFNKVFNFMMCDTYMQPHLHPSHEKIEHIYLIEGEIAVLYFDNLGSVEDIFILKKGSMESIIVPGFVWHTYVVISEFAITYETMMGKYDPQTWKKFLDIAPSEDSDRSSYYLRELKTAVSKKEK